MNDEDEIDVDAWLTGLAGSPLEAIDRQLAAEGPSLDNYRLFRGLDDWVWALLLGRRYTCYPSILGTLPEVPVPAMQERWSGAHGLTLLSRSLAFYRHVRAMQSTHGPGTSLAARILDFGCGWGRLTRFFCRDVEIGCLHACDPAEEMLEICRRSRLPADLHRAEPAPGELAEGGFHLAYSHSALADLPDEPAAAALGSLHESLNPGGLLIVTIRPPAADPGQRAIGLPDLRDRWGDHFELVDVTVLLEDIDQIAVTLQKI